MKIEVKYRLFNWNGRNYIVENFNRSSIIEVVHTENEAELDKLIKSELSIEINKPINEIKVLKFRRLL
ncbi:hypothetical protein ACFWM3_18255 [Gottfriedia sp. NPDC058432]|uniref:hypothetical protein n=1 Tax=Gottfriedia sp. NPDC058432 TaxID=3346497 RepID=UPI0036586EB6